MVEALDYEIVVSMFELQSRYYVHFRIIPLRKVWTPYPPSYGLNSTTTVLLEGWILYYITQEGWYAIKQQS